jgi:molybdopterin converting factor small subunit
METITLNIVFYGALKAFFGDKLTINKPLGCTITEVIQLLQESKIDAKELLDSCQCAIDSDIISKEHQLMVSSELILLPPFSGG